MAGPAPKAPRKGRAATPALLSGQTDTTAEAEKPPAAPFVDQSTGAAGPEAGAASTHASEQAAGEGAALAVAGVAAAPAALPSGAAAGVENSSTATATGEQGPDAEQVSQTEQEPAGDVVAEAGAAPASEEPVDKDGAASAGSEGNQPVADLDPAPVAAPLPDPAEISHVHERLVDDEVRAKLDEAEASGLLDDAVFVEMLLRYPIRVAAGATRWRAGIFWTARETRVLQPGELDVVQFFRIVRDRDFTVHILTNVFGQPGE